VPLAAPRLFATWSSLSLPRALSPTPDAAQDLSGALQQCYAPSRSSGAIMDVVVWLRSLGLGQYEAAFRQNLELHNAR
jgi:hypothetical protein